MKTITKVARRLLAIGLTATLASCTGDAQEKPELDADVSTSSVCTGPSGVGTTVPAGLGPGDLVTSQPLNPTGDAAAGFPTNADLWQILYVSTGTDETDLQLVCGIVAAPSAGPVIQEGKAKILAWSHGTVGMKQQCLPSSDPTKLFWGAMPGGIGAVGFDDPQGLYKGSSENGALQYAMNQGWVVAATDYQPNDTYVIGKIAAANVLDSTRAATQLVAQQHSQLEKPSEYQMISWGHSQGGHAALWAGQLAESYFAGTSPSKPTPKITLSGVVALAPASTFITDPTTGGHGLADWEMHQTIEAVGLPVPKLELQIGPALFSYIFGSWGTFSESKAPLPTALFPAFPSQSAPLAPGAVLTTQGQE
ncbi:MAG: lipase family protein, partial [Mycobacteriaceae bacterium]